MFNDKLFDTQFIFDSPDGKNINQACGSQHTKKLQKRVCREKADLGIAFDGDADRLIAVDEKGNVITGDRILAICAKFAKQKGDLHPNTVVSTIMSNIGLGEMLDNHGIQHIKSNVGDRKVLEQMKKSGAVIGGEDSGHIIFLDSHTTGDGLLCALKLIEVMLETKKTLSSLAAVMTVYPQVLKNIEVSEFLPDLLNKNLIADTIKEVEYKLEGKGRVLIRYSGTQPLLRVMVEGPDQDLIDRYCDIICDSIKAAIKKEL